MLSFDEALARILVDVSSLSAELVPLQEAAGRVLATAQTTSFPLPPFEYSERDGYALDAGSLTGEGPFRLVVTGEQRAGERLEATLAAGSAARIFTGAALPRGGNAVVMQEDVQREGEWVVLSDRPAAGTFVRRRGADLSAGAVALSAGTRLGAPALALAAMLGLSELPVSRRPRLAILPNGDELRAPGAVLHHGEIYESNAVALAALARQAGADAVALPIVADDAAAAEHAITDALARCDLLVTVGGVSVGEHDVIRPALERAGVTLDFWRVAIKPGKPLAFGRRGAVRVLGLPGNPASALVTFGLFGLPLLRALQGDVRPRPFVQRARLQQPQALAQEREQFVRVTVESRDDGLWLTALAQQAAGAAVSLAESDGLGRLPRGSGLLAAGALVPFLRWSDL